MQHTTQKNGGKMTWGEARNWKEHKQQAKMDKHEEKEGIVKCNCKDNMQRPFLKKWAPLIHPVHQVHGGLKNYNMTQNMT